MPAGAHMGCEGRLVANFVGKRDLDSLLVCCKKRLFFFRRKGSSWDQPALGELWISGEPETRENIIL